MNSMVTRNAPMNTRSLLPTNVLRRRDVPVLGTMTDERHQLDERVKNDEEASRKVVKMTRRERVVRGDENSIYDAFQPFEVP